MSWLSKLGHGVIKGVQVAAPAISIASAMGLPGAGLANAIIQGPLRAQAAFTESGKGADKAALVVAEFEAALETTKGIAAASGKSVQYDSAKLQAAIDAQVVAYKLIADAVASIRIVDTPPPPAATAAK